MLGGKGAANATFSHKSKKPKINVEEELKGKGTFESIGKADKGQAIGTKMLKRCQMGLTDLLPGGYEARLKKLTDGDLY